MYPDIESLNLRPDDRSFKFDRELGGYKKRQVDDKLNMLFGQLDDLRARNRQLTDALGTFDEQLRVLTENARQLERERHLENARLISALSGNGKATEETAAQARRQAEQCLADARREAQRIIDGARQQAQAVARRADANAAARNSLAALEQCLLAFRRDSGKHFADSEKHFANIAAVFRDAKSAWSAQADSPERARPYTPPPVPIPVPPPAPVPVPPQRPVFAPEQPFTPLAPPESAPDSYDDLLKTLGIVPDDRHPIPPRKCVGRFGE